MIQVLQHDDAQTPEKLSAILSRSTDFDPGLEASVRRIVSDVRARGDAAVLEYTLQFDGATLAPAGIRVPDADVASAAASVDPDLIEAMRAAADNVQRFHDAQKRTSWFLEEGDGVILGKRFVPLDRVALLVPGASAPLFSSLLMSAIPARIAGVPQVCVATPPRPDGSVHPVVLAAAHLAGITEVYRVFGAQAVAALAYGTEAIPRVDKLVGPGHPAVQIAKKMVFGTVDIDMVAGPSEIVVVADQAADPRYVAADLLSQVEHGSGFEAAVCITPSPTLAREVADQVACQAGGLTHRDAMRNALERFGAVVVVPSIADAVELANQIAPEHLELHVESPWEWLDSVRNAGAVFLGPASSEPVGDYFAGTNHILPTAGAARFASSVGVDTFLKNISVVAYTRRRLRRTSAQIVRLAEAEGLDAHANAIRMRE